MSIQIFIICHFISCHVNVVYIWNTFVDKKNNNNNTNNDNNNKQYVLLNLCNKHIHPQAPMQVHLKLSLG